MLLEEHIVLLNSKDLMNYNLIDNEIDNTHHHARPRALSRNRINKEWYFSG